MSRSAKKETYAMKPDKPNKPNKPFLFNIIVNGRPRKVDYERISYSQVVSLAFPSTEPVLYSVHYVGPKIPDGTLADGQLVQLTNGMKFDVSKTNRS